MLPGHPVGWGLGDGVPRWVLGWLTGMGGLSGRGLRGNMVVILRRHRG